MAARPAMKFKAGNTAGDSSRGIEIPVNELYRPRSDKWPRRASSGRTRKCREVRLQKSRVAAAGYSGRGDARMDFNVQCASCFLNLVKLLTGSLYNR